MATTSSPIIYYAATKRKRLTTPPPSQTANTFRNAWHEARPLLCCSRPPTHSLISMTSLLRKKSLSLLVLHQHLNLRLLNMWLKQPLGGLLGRKTLLRPLTRINPRNLPLLHKRKLLLNLYKHLLSPHSLNPHTSPAIPQYNSAPPLSSVRRLPMTLLSLPLTCSTTTTTMMSLRPLSLQARSCPPQAPLRPRRQDRKPRSRLFLLMVLVLKAVRPLSAINPAKVSLHSRALENPSSNTPPSVPETQHVTKTCLLAHDSLFRTIRSSP